MRSTDTHGKLRWGRKSANSRKIPKIKEVEVQLIRSQHNRPLSPEVVAGIADSASRIGIQNPISLRPIEDSVYEFEVVAGDHRLAACKELGWKFIPARILTGAAARIQRHSENLHRSELSLLERYRAIAGYGKESKKSNAINLRGGSQPHDRGVSRIARAFKTSRQEVQRAMAAEKIAPDVRDLIARSKLSKNAAAIARIAQEGSLEAQFRKLKELDERRQAKQEAKPVASAEVTADTMLASWINSSTEALWKCASVRERKIFIDLVMAQKTREDAKDWD